MNHLGSKILTTKRLILRPFRTKDAKRMFDNWAADPDVTKFLDWSPHKNAGETRALLKVWEEESKKPNVYHWAITLDGEPIGDIALVAVSENSAAAVVGYCLSRRYWGQGIMTEALAEVLRFCFEEVGFHRISSSHAAENPASGKVMEKCGLRYEGTLRKHIRLHSWGEYAYVVLRGILEEEYFMLK